MQHTMKAYISKFLRDKARRRKAISILCVLSLFVTSGVFWQLRLTGITLSAAAGDACCGIEEHRHTEDCIGEKVLICGLEEGAAPVEPELPAGPTQLPAQPEAPAEQPAEPEAPAEPEVPEAKPSMLSQWFSKREEPAQAPQPEVPAEPVLTCTQEEHAHGDSCYETKTVLVCTEDHEHTETCYTEEQVLICEVAEHAHGDGCWTVPEAPEAPEAPAAPEPPQSAEPEEDPVVEEEPTEEPPAAAPHVHTDACYKITYICGKEDHIHGVECYSNIHADEEEAEDWEATLPEELTGVWAEDLIAVAESQLGYTESTANYELAEDGATKKGYTRYGAWYSPDYPYGDWSAMFVSFCLHYAGIPEEVIPQNSGVKTMLADAKKAGIFVEAGEYLAEAGNLVFVDSDANGTADRIGVVTEAGEEGFTAISGDVTVEEADQVAAVEYPNDDAGIQGYVAVSQMDAEEFDLLLEDVELLEEKKYSEEIANTILTESAANDWQIVSGGYSENFPWTYNDEKNVRMRKEVVPTGTENEFYIYMEVQNKMSWADIFTGSSGPIITTKNYHGSNSSTSYSVEKYDYLFYAADQETPPNDTAVAVGGNASKLFFDKATADAVYGVNEYNTFYFSLYMHKDGNNDGDYDDPEDTVTEGLASVPCYGTTSKIENGSVLFPINALGITYVCGPINCQGTADEKIRLDVYPTEAGGPTWDFSEKKVNLNNVADIMIDSLNEDDYIIYEGEVTYDGTVTVRETNGEYKSIDWTPGTGEPLPLETVDGGTTQWISHRLLYKIRLDVEKEGFDSCAEHLDNDETAEDKKINTTNWVYETNQDTKLEYTVTTKIEGSEEITEERDPLPVDSPQVKGLLYDIRFVKHGQIDENPSYPLAGAEFTLYEEDGETPVYMPGTETPYTATSNEKGEVNIFNLPWGRYILKESKVPAGYNGADPGQWELFDLCYTTSKDKVTQDLLGAVAETETLKAPNVCAHPERNMRWKGNDNSDGVWIITNPKDDYVYSLIVQKVDASQEPKPLAGAEFALKAPDGSVLETITTDAEGKITFTSELTPGLVYILSEVKAPDGYYGLPADIQFAIEKQEDGVTYKAVIKNADAFEDGQITIAPETDNVLDEPHEFTITVKNKTGSELPNTGGAGTSLYTFGGLLLMAAPLVYGYMQRRRKEMELGD